MGFSRTGISCILILHYLAMFYVNCQAPVNLKAVFDIKTGNINVTWEDPSGGVPRNGYLFTYNAPSISRKDITGLRQMHYEIRPPVLGEIYKISVYAERPTGISPAAETTIASPKSEYKSRGSTVSITLTGIGSGIWEVRHDMEFLFAIVGGSITGENLPGKATATLSPDKTQAILTIQNVDVQNAGLYMLKPRNSPETIDSVLLVITVKPSTPAITITPSTAVVGLPVTLHCQSQSNSVPEHYDLKLMYTWRINDTDITPRPRFTINNNNLIISTLDIRNKYDIYFCIATETNGLTSDPGSMHLQLIYGPQTVTLNPTTTFIIVEEGTPIAPIRCETDCNPACTLRWIISDNRPSIIGGILNLEAAGRNEDSTYTCVAAAESPVPLNLRSLRSDVVRVDVQYKASITEVSHSINGKNKGPISDGQEIEINERDNLALRCNVDADPLAVVKLLDEENNVLSTDTISSLYKELIQMKCEQTGKYIFQASNKYNSEPASQALHVKVRCSPRELSEVPKVLEGKRNTWILLMTTIIAYPTPTATWKSGVSGATVVQINDYTFSIIAFVDISREEFYGSYNVTISNGLQSDLMLGFIVRSQANVVRNEPKGIDKTDENNSLVVGICVSAIFGVGGILLAMVTVLKLHKMKGKLKLTRTQPRRNINDDIPLEDLTTNAELHGASGSDYQGLDESMIAPPSVYDNARTTGADQRSNYQLLDANMVAPPSIYENKRTAGPVTRNSPIPTNESSLYDEI